MLSLEERVLKVNETAKAKTQRRDSTKTKAE